MARTRVVYWNTACLEPSIEAVSKELFELAAHFPDSRLFAVSPHLGFRREDGGRVLGFHPRWDLTLRLLIPWVERGARISHVYSDPSPWLFHRTLRRRPLVWTVATEAGRLLEPFADRCRVVVAQTEGFRRRLREAGLPEDRLRWIPPGIDLDRFRPSASRPEGGPRLLFASAPRSAEELEARGVPLLIDAARQAPEMSVRLLYRQWRSGYTSLAPTEEAVRGLANVELVRESVKDMAGEYPGHHFTVIPYTTPDGGKECPNSLLEGMACGVPALVSDAAPFAEYVRQHGCGEVFEPTPAGLAVAVERGLARWDERSRAARTAAERDFDRRVTLRRYEEVYDGLE
ncbi:MAG TPA: glycosyltransferase [bacterium]|nr:glycosyltransferase [bacterium]